MTLEDQLSALQSADRIWRRERPVEARHSLGGSPYDADINALKGAISAREQMVKVMRYLDLRALADEALERGDHLQAIKLQLQMMGAAEAAFGDPLATLTDDGEVIPGPPIIIGGRAPLHHIATDKNVVSKLRGGPWTPRFEAIFRRAGLSLKDAVNKVRVAGHSGPHPEAYHRAVFDRLLSATNGLRGGTDAYRQAVIRELEKIGKEAATRGTSLNKLLTQ